MVGRQTQITSLSHFLEEIACTPSLPSPGSWRGDFTGSQLLESMSLSYSKAERENISTWECGQRMSLSLGPYTYHLVLLNVF